MREEDPEWTAYHEVAETLRKKKRVETISGKFSGRLGVLGQTRTEVLAPIVNQPNCEVATRGLEKNRIL